jgi:hypothetical protein
VQTLTIGTDTDATAFRARLSQASPAETRKYQSAGAKGILWKILLLAGTLNNITKITPGAIIHTPIGDMRVTNIFSSFTYDCALAIHQR